MEEYTAPTNRLLYPDGAIAHQRLLVAPVKMELAPVPMPVLHLEDEIRRLQGQTISFNFQPSEAFLVDFRRIYASVKQVMVTIADGVRQAMQTLVQFLTSNPHLFPSVSPQRIHLSKQSRHYLMVKQREQVRRLRHGRKAS